jgi:hypothetical protein
VPAAPSNEPRSLTVREVHDEFDALLADRRHMGLRNLIGDATLEPRNPFQRTRRKAQRWAVAAFGILLLGFLIFGYFHLR